MNRRQFTQSLGAIAALPAMPSVAFATTSARSSTALASQARYWAIYMSEMHNVCTPATLSKMLNIPVAQARAVTAQLVKDNVLTLSQTLDPSLVSSGGNSPFDRLKDQAKAWVESVFEETEPDPENPTDNPDRAEMSEPQETEP